MHYTCGVAPVDADRQAQNAYRPKVSPGDTSTERQGTLFFHLSPLAQKFSYLRDVLLGNV